MITITTKAPLGLATIGLTCLAIAACGGGSKGHSSQGASSSTPSNDGYAATISDFANYQNWPLVDYTIGNASEGLKSAHRAGSDQYLRKTFANGAAQNSTAGEFDEGAIFIKETFTYERDGNEWHKAFADQGGLLAMVKRGGDFNPNHGGWEWFMLSADLSEVVAQGADLMNGACNGCHSQAEMLGGMDYSFPKPTEFVIDTAVFADYTEWDMVEFTTEDIPNLGSAHQNTGDTPPLRRIFQKQVLANPEEAGDFGYPIGTVIVKDVLVDNQVKEIVAMVKRGGEFAPANNGWEWLMLDSSNPSQVAEVNGNSMRGDLAMCTGCHSKAIDDDGKDYVFSHSFAPFSEQAAGEFIAIKADLHSYTQWTVTDYALGNSNPFLGGAHASGTDVNSRQVFENEKALMQTGSEPYLPGSIIAKEVFTTVDGEKSFQGVFAMIKRGGMFNPDHSAWEWMILDGESNMLERGSDLKGGACNSCHEKGMDAAGVDYTFNKPSTIAVDETAIKTMIADYTQWTLVQEATGAPAANVGGHATGSHIVRKTYKKQAAANPYVEADHYPVGTVYVKEIVNDGTVGTIYGMVKSSTSWTWFTTNAAMNTVSFYSGTTCSGCHSLAGDPDRITSDSSYMGKDFVFYKENDPVAMPVPMP